MKRVSILLSGAVCALVGMASAQAADLAAGKAAFEKNGCVACHGAAGDKTIAPMYPILAGQHDDYLVHALTAYQRGVSNAPNSANIRKNPIMGNEIKKLGSADIVNIAAWLAAQKGPLTHNRK